MEDHTFTVQEAAALLDLTQAEVRSFARAGLEGDADDLDRGFGFRDLVVLRMAAGLRRARVPSRQVARALAGAKRTSRGQVAGLRLEALGDHVVVRDGEVVWRADSGQLDFGLAGTRASEPSPPGSAPETASETPLRGSRPEGDQDLDGLACLERGREVETDDPQAATGWYHRAIDLEPDLWEAHAALGFVLQQDGRTEAAVESYRRASSIESDATVAFNLGVALDDLGRSADAEAAYSSALDLDPGLADAHFNLSCLHERLGDRNRALRHMIAYRELTAGD